MNAIVVPSSLVSIRTATMSDLPFMDALQKKHSKQLGYFPTQQFTGYIEGGNVLIAEDSSGARLGYCISKDRYLKRDELGVIYQLCVVPGEQRKLVGASLIKEVFARSAYGCRLYCCWCAQDISANYFWESLGFIPVAFRAGSDRKRRVHIFWQRRINADDEATRYWYPSQTNSGAIREDRLVFPIPPGTHWTEVKAVVVPGVERPEQKRLEGAPKRKESKPISRRGSVVRLSGLRAVASEAPPQKREKAVKGPKAKIDPKFVAAARELRDRYLEQVSERPYLLAQGKYDVGRMMGERSLPMQSFPALPAA